MENCYSYVFWYNEYEKIWTAIPRESYAEFFSGRIKKEKVPGIYRSSRIETLIDILRNPKVIEDLDNDQ